LDYWSADGLQGDSPLKAGVRILPFIVVIVFFSLVNGALMPKFGYYMPWYLGGSILALIGSALMCKWHSALEDYQGLSFMQTPSRSTLPSPLYMDIPYSSASASDHMSLLAFLSYRSLSLRTTSTTQSVSWQSVRLPSDHLPNPASDPFELMLT